MCANLRITDFSPGKTAGASPSEHKYYVMVFFDISDAKKYRLLVRVLKRYGVRVQKSVFEAQLRPSQVRELKDAIEGLMCSDRYYNPDDNVRMYKISGNCDATVYGEYSPLLPEENIFF